MQCVWKRDPERESKKRPTNLSDSRTPNPLVEEHDALERKHADEHREGDGRSPADDDLLEHRDIQLAVIAHQPFATLKSNGTVHANDKSINTRVDKVILGHQLSAGFGVDVSALGQLLIGLSIRRCAEIAYRRDVILFRKNRATRSTKLGSPYCLQNSRHRSSATFLFVPWFFLSTELRIQSV